MAWAASPVSTTVNVAVPPRLSAMTSSTSSSSRRRLASIERALRRVQPGVLPEGDVGGQLREAVVQVRGDEGADDLVEARPWLGTGGGQPPIEAGQDDVVGLVQELAQQVLLRREVVVERGDTDAGAGGDVAHRGAFVAVLAHDRDGRPHHGGLARTVLASALRPDAHSGTVPVEVSSTDRTTAKFPCAPERGLGSRRSVRDRSAADGPCRSWSTGREACCRRSPWRRRGGPRSSRSSPPCASSSGGDRRCCACWRGDQFPGGAVTYLAEVVQGDPSAASVAVARRCCPTTSAACRTPGLVGRRPTSRGRRAT